MKIIIFLTLLSFLALSEPITNCDIPTGTLTSKSSSDIASCMELCNKNKLCLGVTFISGWNRCFLKNNNKIKKGIRFYSGIIAAPVNGVRNIVEEAYDIDYPVGDIKKNEDYKTYEECKNACKDYDKCLAFGFIEGYNLCWFKNKHHKKVTKVFYCEVK